MTMKVRRLESSVHSLQEEKKQLADALEESNSSLTEIQQALDWKEPQ